MSPLPHDPPAILYHPDGYAVDGTRPIGRRVAGRDFLRAHLETAASRGVPRLSVVGVDRACGLEFAQLARASGFRGRVRIVPFQSIGAIADDGVLHLPDPMLGPHVLAREAHGRAAWSVSGVIHTLASAQVLDAIGRLATAPVADWDAIICTSRAGRDVVVAVLDQSESWLRHHIGATRATRPQLPVIPLGIHTADFEWEADGRALARASFGLSPHDLVVTHVGRLSAHAKAHPVPLFLALDRAARHLDREIHLLACGTYPDPEHDAAYREVARHFARVRLHIVGGTVPATDEEKLRCLAAADVFASLSDNLQETFGIAVVEAMAARLPVLVSDWSGYRDTVRHGVDGLLVPTFCPPISSARAIVDSHASGALDYDTYVGARSQHCVVDIDAAAAGFVSLLSHPERAVEMGHAGRDRVRSQYDWSEIYRRYGELWTELAGRRRAGASDLKSNTSGDVHRSFPTAHTDLNTRWSLHPAADLGVLDLGIVDGLIRLVVDPETQRELVNLFESREWTPLELARNLRPGLVDELELTALATKLSSQIHAIAKYGALHRVDSSAEST